MFCLFFWGGGVMMFVGLTDFFVVFLTKGKGKDFDL